MSSSAFLAQMLHVSEDYVLKSQHNPRSLKIHYPKLEEALRPFEDKIEAIQAAKRDLCICKVEGCLKNFKITEAHGV